MSLPVVLSEALQHLYQGQPWLDVTFMEHLSELDAKQASRRFDTSHNIWELVNHLIFWHQNVDRKLKGEKPEQEGDLPDFYFPENHGENNWQATLQRFGHSVTHMVETIRISRKKSSGRTCRIRNTMLITTCRASCSMRPITWARSSCYANTLNHNGKRR